MGPEVLPGHDRRQPSIRNIPRVGKTSEADAPAPAPGHPPHALGNDLETTIARPYREGCECPSESEERGAEPPAWTGNHGPHRSQHADHPRPNEPTAGRGPNAASGRRLIAAFALVAIALTGQVVVAAPSPAFAADYPTWQEVQAAKRDTAAGAAAVKQITALIAQLAANVEATRLEAERRTEELFVAQQKYDDAVQRAATIQAEADASAAEAAEAERNAGQVAAQLYRTGGSDLGVNLFLEAGNSGATDVLLSKLGNMSKMVERTSGIYEAAQEKGNSAQSLSDQAEVARGEREKLRVAAEEALAAAQAAQAAAEAALAESEAKKIELDQQLKFLKDAEAKTTAAYQEGERVRKAEEERRRKEEERRRQEAIKNGSPGVGGGLGLVEAGVGLDLGQLRPPTGDLRRRVLLEQLPLRAPTSPPAATPRSTPRTAGR